MSFSDHLGIFVSVYPDKASKQKISDFIQYSNVPNPIDKSKMHCTIMHSLRHARIAPNHHCDVVASSGGLEVWELPDKGFGVKYALVLMVKSYALWNRYNEIILHGGVCQYDDFRPHITLSMDVPKWFLNRCHDFKHDIRFVREEIAECRGATAPLQ